MSMNGIILVIDDNPDWQTILGLLLGNDGYEVIPAEEYSTALDRIVRAGSWLTVADLAACVVDLRFEDSPVEKNYDGLGLLAVCKIQGIPTVVVSGYLTPEFKEQLCTCPLKLDTFKGFHLERRRTPTAL